MLIKLCKKIKKINKIGILFFLFLVKMLFINENRNVYIVGCFVERVINCYLLS